MPTANLSHGGWYEVEAIWTGHAKPVRSGCHRREIMLLEDVKVGRIRLSHAWVKISKRFRRFSFVPGDTIKFVGQAAPFQRADGTQDWAFAPSPDIMQVKAA